MTMSVRSWCLRLAIIVFWVSSIFLFLFSPKAFQLFSDKKSINLFIWPMILDPRVLTEFEQETGIKVYMTYYESNEELYSKLKATKGEGYDIVVPTDYTVELLIKDGFLKQIDASKLDFMHRLKPYLVGNYYDPKNEYSLPYYMSFFGFGVNKSYFGDDMTPLSWNIIFDKKKVRSSFCMLDNPREAILLATYYLFGTIDIAYTPEQLDRIKNLLLEQKEWVEVYTSARIEELLASSSCPLAVGTSPDVWKAAREYGHIEFVFPQEGSFVTIDSFVIPKATAKDDLIYQLLNFLYRKNILQANSDKYGFCSPVIDVQEEKYGIFCPTQEQFNNINFFRNVLTKQQIQDMWVAVKSR